MSHRRQLASQRNTNETSTRHQRDINKTYEHEDNTTVYKHLKQATINNTISRMRSRNDVSVYPIFIIGLSSDKTN